MMTMLDASASKKAMLVDLLDLLGKSEIPSERAPVPRREERKPASWLAVIRLPDGEEIPSSVKDISKSGARLSIPDYYEIPETFLFRVIGKDFLLRARLAWRRNGYAGVEIMGIAKTPPAAPSLPPMEQQGSGRLPEARMQARPLVSRR